MCEKKVFPTVVTENGEVIAQSVEYTKALNPDSVEIVLGAKSEVRFTVKAYGETVEESKERATKIFDELYKEYYGESLRKDVVKV